MSQVSDFSDDPAAHSVNDRLSPLKKLRAKIFGSSADLQGKSANQFILSLRATYLAIKSKPMLPESQLIADEIDSVLSKYKGGMSGASESDVWDDAFQCERLLVNLYDPQRLEVELSRRILEAREYKLSFAEFYAGKVQSPGDSQTPISEQQLEANRSLLARLIEDLQWYNTQLYIKRGYAHIAQKRVFGTFLVAFCIFAAVMYAIFDLAITSEAAQKASQIMTGSAAA